MANTKLKVNSPVFNPDLRKYIDEVKANPSPENNGKVFQEIATKAEFLSGVTIDREPIEAEDGSRVIADGTNMNMKLLETKNKEGKILRFYAAFTDWSELKKWKGISEGITTVTFGFDDYYKLIQANPVITGVVINPFSDNIILSKEMLERLHVIKENDGKNPAAESKVEEKEVKINIGDFNEFPVILAENMREIMRQYETVERAWLRIMQAENQQPQVLLIADMDPSKVEEAMISLLSESVRKHIGENDKLTVVPLDSDFGKQAITNAEPFFVRSEDLVLNAPKDQKKVEELVEEKEKEEREQQKGKFSFFKKKK